MKNTFVKVLSFLMALTMIVGTLGTVVVFAADCTHANLSEETLVEKVQATCLVPGYEKHVCPDCNKEVIANPTPTVANHNYVKQPATKATCDTNGYDVYYECSICKGLKEPKKETEHMLGHAWSTYTVKKAATCTAEGYTSVECLNCGVIAAEAKYPDNYDMTRGTFAKLDKAPHDLKYTVTVAPVACKDGELTITCKNCPYKNVVIEEATHKWVTLASQNLAPKDENDKISCYPYVSGMICTDCKALKDEKVNENSVCTYVQKGIGTDGTETTVTASNITTLLKEAGYQIGDALHKDATCAAAGYYWGYCEYHKEYKKVPLSNKDIKHDWEVDATRTAASVAANKKDCTVESRTYYVCSEETCDATKDEVLTKAKAAHEYKKTGAKVEVKKTCTKNGITTYNCDNCDEMHEVVDYATGHNLGPATAPASYDCTVGYKKTKTCQNTWCDDQDTTKTGLQPYYEEEPVAAVSAHTWGTTLEEAGATCVTAAHYIKLCTKCTKTTDDTETKDDDPKEKPTDDAAARADKHIVLIDKTQGTATTDVVQVGNCAQVEKTNYVCKCGDIVPVETKAVAAHTWGTKYDANKDGDYKDAGDKDYSEIVADCNNKGQTEGKVCTVCGKDDTIPKPTEINPDNHDGTKTAVGSYVSATCKEGGYQLYYWSCCKDTFKDYDKHTTGDNAGKPIGPIATNHKWSDEIKEVEATCTKTGTKAHYKCELCGVLSRDKSTIVKDADLVIATPNKGQHDWMDVERQEETCTDSGNVAHKACKRDGCTAVLVGTEIKEDDPTTKNVNEAAAFVAIAAHGNKYLGYHAGKKATCTTDGYYYGLDDNDQPIYTAVYACSKCDKEVAPKTNHVGTSTSTPVNYYIAEGTSDKKIVNCTLETYDLVVCSACGYTYMDNYVKAAKTAHVYPTTGEGANKVEVPNDNKTVGATCVTNGKLFYECEHCDYTDERVGDLATGHFKTVNGVKVVISASCKDIANFDGWTCEGCNATVDKTKTGYTTTTIGVEHAKVDYEVVADCVNPGYHIIYCENCDVTFPLPEGVKAYTPAKGHEKSFLVETVAATATVDGYERYRCAVCGATHDVVIPASGAALTATVTYSANKIAAGETVDVIVTVAGKAVNYTTAAVTLYFDEGNIFEIVDATAGDAKATAVAGDNGVSIYVPNDAEGNAQTAAVAAEGTVVVTVTLKAKRYANGSEKITADVVFNQGVKDAEAKADEQVEQKLAVTVAGLGNLNGDAYFTAEDALAIHNLIGKDYNATADVNNDGEVNLADAIAVAKYAASNKKAIDFLKMIGEYDAIEEIVMGLYNDGMLADMDGDRVVLINDVYKLLNKINTELNADTFEYESVEDLVYTVMTK